MTPTILVTGGPVHAYLDDVKIITNRFHGGLMAELAENLAKNYRCQVQYLCSKDAVKPNGVNYICHDGFDDYQKQGGRLWHSAGRYGSMGLCCRMESARRIHAEGTSAAYNSVKPQGPWTTCETHVDIAHTLVAIWFGLEIW